MRERMAEAVTAAEEGFARVVAQAESDRAAAEAAGRQAITVGRDAFAGADAAGAAVLEGFAKARQEVAEFVAERIRRDIETQGELLGCRSLDELRDVQSRFFRAAVDQYAAEASRLMQLGSDVVVRAMPRAGR
jgi:hypothetical protein